MEIKLHLIFFLICIIFYKNVVKCNNNNNKNIISKSYNNIRKNFSKWNNSSINDKDNDENLNTEEHIRKSISNYKNYLLRLKNFLDSSKESKEENSDNYDKNDENYEDNNFEHNPIENKNNESYDNKNDNNESDSIDESTVEGNNEYSNEKNSNEHDGNGDDTSEENEEMLEKFANFQEINRKYMELQGNSEDENNVYNKYDTESYDEDGDGKKVLSAYDIKIMETVRQVSIRASRMDVNYFKDIDKEFKNCFDKHDFLFCKMADKIKIDLGNGNMKNKEYAINKLETLFNQINKDYIEKDNFDLHNYLLDLKFINFFVLNKASDNYNDIVNLVNDINSKIELSSIDGIINSFVHNKNINYKIKENITNIITKTSIKYFKIEINKEKKLFLPVLEYHNNKSLNYISDTFFRNNKICENKMCPSNSNCYIIGLEEVCRCFPGFKELIEDNTIKCVKDDEIDCMKNNGGCDSNAKCVFEEKKIVCECNVDYEGDGIYCSNAFFNSINILIFLIVLIFNLYIL
ncbi:merozoite surface protein 8, putative [Plasmodium relictum]|uniref:Merozoite surface protein 8, putative n=1 Tax=Plasmodium relictum TaxID=85471 RepID=A0A1J1H7W3_PLARL|nr:merozoite surface protein 8, putative [Plasmodium relictum]CRH00645.1 merozoite surface protein 8, putative [Plasmodium relictum]